MIINSVKLKNFKSYYDLNKFEFSKGLNIVSGHEGSGKSNLFDAFMWTLFNSISGLSRNQRLDGDNVTFINDRIKNERFMDNSNEEIICEVCINLTIPKSISSDNERTYEIIRRKSISLNTSLEGTSFHADNMWKYNNSELILSWQDEAFNESDVYDRDAVEAMDQIFPEKIRKYIWFQGEQLQDLLDFENENTLKKAVDFISYLSTYVNMEEIISEIHDMLNVKTRNIIKKNTSNKNKFDLLTAQLKQVEKDIKKVSELELKKKKELLALEDDEKEQLEKLTVLAGFPELKSQESTLQNRLNSLKDEVSRLNQEEKEKFVKKWMLKGTSQLFEEARMELMKFTQYRFDLISENDKQLSEGIPGDELIHQMLAKEHCIICDTKAPKGGEKYRNIESHLDLNKDLSPNDPIIESLNDKVVNLRDKPGRLIQKLISIDDEIFEHQSKITTKLESRNRTNTDLKNTSEKISEMIREKGHSVLNLNSNLINSSLRRIKEDKEVINKQLNKYSRDYFINSNKKKQLFEEIKKLRNPDLETPIEEKLLDYTSHIKECIKEQVGCQKVELLSKIEETANSIQKNIANINNVVIVYVKIDPDDYTLSFFDAEGNPNPGHGAQNTLAKMSIINAIVKLSNDMKGLQYPFIADAPTSDFAAEFTDRFLESISNTYEQSIIITKDVVESSEKYKKKKYISKFIEITKVSQGEISLSTNSITSITA